MQSQSLFRILPTALCLAAAVHAQTLPLKNPGFEDGTRGWSLQEWSTGEIAGTEIFADPVDPHSGKSSLCVKWREGGDNLLVNPVEFLAVKSGETYRISFWSRSAEAARVQLTVDFFDAAGKKTGKALHKRFDNDTRWRQWDYEFQAPEKAVKMRFYLRCRKVAGNFDDVAVRHIAPEPASAGKNLLKNPGFEENFKHWGQFEWSGKPAKIHYIADKTSPRSGEKCARIQWESGGDNILIGQPVRVGENKNFLLSFWAKSDVEVSHNDRVQATVRFLNAAGKEVAAARHKIFSTGNIYEEFRWSFTAPEACTSLFVYLRCRKTAACFDDVSLMESHGVHLRSCFIWLPENQLVLNIFNALPSQKSAELEVELFDRQGKQVFRGKVEAAYGADSVAAVPLGRLAPGPYKVKVYPAGDESRAATDQVLYPDTDVKWPKPYDKLKVRNNFVTELAVSDRPTELKSGRKLEFPNPRRGWVFFAFTPESDGLLQLPGKRQVQLHLRRGVPVESMQMLDEGLNQVTALTDVKLASHSITTMAEVIADEYESDAARRKFTDGLMDSYAMREFLRNSNVVQERFPNHNVLTPDGIPESERPRIAAWRASGRYTITTVTRTGFGPRWKVRPEDTAAFWLSRVGLRELDGLFIDEFGSEKADETPFFAPAVREINRQYPDKMLAAAACAAWYSHTRTNDLRAALAEGKHAYAPEQYLREQPDEGAAKNYINDFFEYARLWEKTFPGAIGNTLWCYGSCDAYAAYYGLDCFASCDYKYFLDMQFAVLVNDPVFFGQRGVVPWIIRYTRPDTLLWQAKLIRHYLIEGKRTLLSKEYGYQFDARHLTDGDCAEGLRHWRVQAAAPGSVAARSIKDYGFSRGTRNTPPAGDTVIEFRRVPGKVNRIGQTLRNLKPGKYYEVSVRTADGDDVDRDTPVMKLMTLRMTVRGAEMLPDRSAVRVYQVVPNNTRGRRRGIVGNRYDLVFRAVAPEAELVLSDEVPDIAAKSYHGQKFAPADPAQNKVIFNFVQVTELLDETGSR